jgi:hypothetical protein
MNLCDAAAAAVCGLRSGVVDMDDQSSICCTSLCTSLLREWPDYFVLVMAAVKFAPTWKNAYSVESRGIPDDGDYQYFALNRDTYHLGNCFILYKPNRIVIGTMMKLQLIQSSNAMPGSLFLDLEHSQ